MEEQGRGAYQDCKGGTRAGCQNSRQVLFKKGQITCFLTLMEVLKALTEFACTQWTRKKVNLSLEADAQKNET